MAQPPPTPLLDRLAEAFRHTALPELEREIAFHARLTDDRQAIAAAATWRGARGRVHPRQRRMPREVKARAGAALQELRLEGVASFEQCLGRVNATIGGVHGVGEVAVYDVALRLAAGRGLLPSRVRLHAATRECARLLGADPGRARWLPVEAFPVPLRDFSPWALERFLGFAREELEALLGPRRGASLSYSLARWRRGLVAPTRRAA